MQRGPKRLQSGVCYPHHCPPQPQGRTSPDTSRACVTRVHTACPDSTPTVPFESHPTQPSCPPPAVTPWGTPIHGADHTPTQDPWPPGQHPALHSRGDARLWGTRLPAYAACKLPRAGGPWALTPSSPHGWCMASMGRDVAGARGQDKGPGSPLLQHTAACPSKQ